MHKAWMHIYAGACFLGGCGFPTFDFRSGAADSGSDADASVACSAAAPSVDLCKTIPRLGSNVCDLAGEVVDSHAAQKFFFAGGTVDNVKEKATVRVGSSVDALHVHVHVVDDNVIVPPNGSQALHEGDAIEIYVSGFAPKSGDFDDTHDIGARHIILAPPSGGIDTRALVWTSSCVAPIPASLLSTYFSGRIVSDGWEIELALPWSFLTPSASPPPTAGATIGFGFSLDAQDDPAAGGRQMQAFIPYRPVTPSPSCEGSCGKTDGQPFCDDRTWCTPTLQ